MEILPIIKSLWRRKIGPVLIVIQLALTTAIIGNVLYITQQRLEKITTPSGIADNELIKISIKKRLANVDMTDIIQRDIEIIRAIPNVLHAAAIDFVPMSGNGSIGTVRRSAEENSTGVQANYYGMTETGIETLGLKLTAGRNFTFDEIQLLQANSSDEATHHLTIVTQAFAEKMFPDEPALDKTVYRAGTPIKIIGIVEQMRGDNPNASYSGKVLFFPQMYYVDAINYVIRTQPENRQTVIQAIIKKLRTMDNSRIVGNEDTVANVIRNTLYADYAMVKILTVVMTMLVFVNAVGIIGLTVFWVNQRRTQIGIRRALGATKSAITRYFILENMLLCLCAIVVGYFLAFVINDYMVRHYSSEPLPWHFVPITGGFLLILTLLATLFPAWQASRISPAQATAGK